ncbi:MULTISPECIES: SDR family NAD(P)-dependent oxidoreductase [Actinosynnema]|uniref:SDR family NAD(P)-dependent oxidoreductase n=1 Tax=Actinosynnema TaxID=40566 RepID=UPI0020A39BC8|nr:SDR family NAD(P)-dependent oxidoreductase [Actinosynnema pretiosum]MCP2095022.1 short chain dehydrogenase [Actinosynnema pretiosum]
MTSTGKTTVVAGGTDGMGRAIALARLRAGDAVVVIGRSGRKAAELARAAGGGALTFLPADLSSTAETRRVAERIAAGHDRVDALVLTANRQSFRRAETPEGLEATFALYYLSRYLLARELAPLLAAAPDPLVVNIAGPGVRRGRIRWDDLQLRERYHPLTAQLQAGRANDLLAVSSAADPRLRAKYVLHHPGFTRTGALDQFPQPLRALVKLYARFAARSVEQAVALPLTWVENPPERRLTVDDRGEPVDLSQSMFDPAAAARLAEATEALLSRR